MEPEHTLQPASSIQVEFIELSNYDVSTQCLQDSSVDVDVGISADQSDTTYLSSTVLSVPCISGEKVKLVAERTDDDNEQKRQLTTRFLNGELTFSEYASLMEEEDAEVESENQPDGERDAAGAADMMEVVIDVDESEVRDEGLGKSEHEEAFEEEFCKIRRRLFRRHGNKEDTRKRKLPPTLQGLMGEANLRYARGEYDTALKICMEIIREAPTAPEPFQTLSMLYEEKEQTDKSLQFSLIAAYLSPNDPDEWIRLAEMSLEQGEAKQAVTCYSKAIKADPNNIDIHYTRCSLLEQMGEKKLALKGYQRLLQVLPPNQGQQCIQLAKEIAKIYHECGEIQKAKESMEVAFEKYPAQITSEDVNLMLELLINLGEHQSCLEILCNHCGVRFQSAADRDSLASLEPSDQLTRFTACEIPQVLAIDLQTKLVVALIHLDSLHLVKDLLAPLHQENPEEVGDLYLDVAEAFMSKEHHRDALPLLTALVKSQNYSLPAVWLRYGECLHAVNELEQASQAYENVVQLAPQHFEARVTLSGILHKLGRSEEAIRTLTQDDEEEPLDCQLLYQRCNILYAEGRFNEFIQTTKLLLSRHCVHIRNRDEVTAISSAKRMSRKSDALRELRCSKGEPEEDQGPAFTDKDVGVEEQWELYFKLCSKLFELRRYDELQRVTFSALGSPLFHKQPDKPKELEFLCLLACIYNNDTYHAYNLAREHVLKNVNNNRAWNLFNHVITQADDIRHNRFLMRLMGRHPEHLALGILNGHNCLVAGTYKYSLSDYMTAFKQDSENPLLALMLGLTFTHMACQKFSAKKHALVVQACSFLNTYLELRGECQESYYNLGRAMHQLGLLPQALFYYKKALEFGPVIKDPELSEIYDMSKEIAFNISVLYQSSGANDLAQMYIQKYILI